MESYELPLTGDPETLMRKIREKVGQDFPNVPIRELGDLYLTEREVLNLDIRVKKQLHIVPMLDGVELPAGAHIVVNVEESVGEVTVPYFSLMDSEELTNTLIIANGDDSMNSFYRRMEEEHGPMKHIKHFGVFSIDGFRFYNADQDVREFSLRPATHLLLQAAFPEHLVNPRDRLYIDEEQRQMFLEGKLDISFFPSLDVANVPRAWADLPVYVFGEDEPVGYARATSVFYARKNVLPQDLVEKAGLENVFSRYVMEEKHPERRGINAFAGLVSGCYINKVDGE